MSNSIFSVVSKQWDAIIFTHSLCCVGNKMPLQFEKLQYIYCLYHVDRIYSHGYIANVWPEVIIIYHTE